MVGAAEYEFQPFYRYVNGFEEGGDDEFVVFGSELNELDGRFEVVEEAVDVGEEDLDFAAGLEEVGNFYNGDEVATVRSACCCCACKKCQI